jgi:DNA-binding NarL/FixJ family response regulator
VEPLRVVLIADDPLVRAGLGALLAGEADLSLVAQLSPDQQVAAIARDLAAETAVWDLGPTAEATLDPLAHAAEAGLRVLALVDHEDGALGALAAGARGTLLREAGGERIAAALQAIARGLLVIDEAAASTVLRPRPSVPPALVEPLTARESEVLQLLAQGLANKAIAERLGISEHTAKFHVNAILGKLAAQSRTEAIVQAARLGLVIL